MKSLFADSGYFIARLNPRDTLHSSAEQLSQTLREAHVVTTEPVLTEVLDFFAAFGPAFRDKAVRIVEILRSSDLVTIVSQTSSLFQRSLELYADRPDKEWGLVDCSSFVVMKEHQITAALAHDHHFEQAGFTALLRGETASERKE